MANDVFVSAKYCWRFFGFVAFTLILPFSVLADTPPSLSAVIHTSMNGISYDTFGDFFKKWHFVTARFRRDTGEMRFTYANDIAWKAMQEGNVKDYPEGAAFGKIGIATQDDPAFTSSAVPAGVQRYQIMLREHGKHPETQDSIYAIFDANYTVHGRDSDAEKSAACAGCHALVPERGYVFSQPMSLGSNAVLPGGMPAVAGGSLAGDASARQIAFRTVPASELPDAPRARLPPGTTEVRLMEGPITDHMFTGTVDEMRPIMAKEVTRSRRPVALVSKEGHEFGLVFFSAEQKNLHATRRVRGKASARPYANGTLHSRA